MGEGATRHFCTEIVHFLSEENWLVSLLEFTAELTQWCTGVLARYTPFKFQNPGGKDHQKLLYMVRLDISVRVEEGKFIRASGQSCTRVPGNECRNSLRLEYCAVRYIQWELVKRTWPYPVFFGKFRAVFLWYCPQPVSIPFAKEVSKFSALFASSISRPSHTSLRCLNLWVF
jgi:hypothetical protein